jgi:hypothetical protein
MKWLLASLLAAFLVYLLYDTLASKPGTVLSRGRLCDHTVAGSVYEDIGDALGRGIRLLEVHVYSDERDQPVVATRPQQAGYDFAEDNVSFEEVCVLLENDAFPSRDPMILSIVPHTTKTVTLNKVAEHLTTITRRHLLEDTGADVATMPLDSLADKLIVVSGDAAIGSALEPLVNLSWSGSSLRRLTYQQALHPRDPKELAKYTQDHIVLVAPQPELKTVTANPNTPLAFGCQWNLFVRGPPGFVVKSSPA